MEDGTKKPDPAQERQPDLPQKKIVYAVITIALVILAAVLIAKFSFNVDLLNPVSGEMSVVARPTIAAMQTPAQKTVVKSTISLRPEMISCSVPQTLCGDSCVDISKDTNNCGACERVCPSRPHTTGTVCMNSKCMIGTCDAGYADCRNTGDTSVNVDGCETNLATGWDGAGTTYVYHINSDQPQRAYVLNALHCGACGKSCYPNPYPRQTLSFCDSGTCRTECWGQWLDCNNNMNDGCEQSWNENNCGACGAKCPQGNLCIHGCCRYQVQNNDGTVWNSPCVADSLGGIQRPYWD